MTLKYHLSPMCGRYQLSKSEKQVREHFGASVDEDYSPRYNISPSQQVPVFQHTEAGGLVFRWKRLTPGQKPFLRNQLSATHSRNNAASFPQMVFMSGSGKARTKHPSVSR
jgi:putative SOS response-associated peptidase YedK